MTTKPVNRRRFSIGCVLAATAVLLAVAGCNLESGNSSPSLPRITSLSVSTAPAGSPDLPLTIKGKDFDIEGHARTWVVWQALGVDTILGSAGSSKTEIDVTVPATLLANPGSALVYVGNFDPMGDQPPRRMDSARFTITASPGSGGSGERTITLSPSSAPAGSADLALKVIGENFDIEGHNRTWIVWSAQGVDTILNFAGGSTTEIDVTVPATSGTALVYARNYDPMADLPPPQGISATFTITEAASAAVEFEAVGSMLAARAGHTATRLDDGQVLIAGGGNSTAELFDPNDAAFVPSGSLAGADYGIAAVRLDTGRVLIVGGSGLSTETYEPSTGTFRPSGALRESHVGPTATLVAGGRVLVTGGTNPISGIGLAIASAEIFDPETGESTVTPPMGSARDGHTAVALTDGTVLVIGGRNGHRPDAADDPPWDPTYCELFDPAVGDFVRRVGMGTTRIGAVAVAFSKDRALVLGGFGTWPQNLHEQPAHPAFAQMYTASSGAFVSLPTPRIVEREFTATLLPNGRVLLIGGSNDGRVLDTVWTLDPATGAFAESGHLTVPRRGHTATLLADGRVLVAGGTDAEGNTLASAEISRVAFTE
jgi:galactose oxidase-like protein/Kelch motif protein